MNFCSESDIGFFFFFLCTYCNIATLEIQHLASCLMFMQLTSYTRCESRFSVCLIRCVRNTNVLSLY